MRHTNFSLRAKWNTANARLANKPFDDLFATPNKEVVKVVDAIFDDLTKRWRITIWRNGKRRIYWRRELNDRLRRLT